MDEYTIDKLKVYGDLTSGSDNISNAVRTMVREYFRLKDR